MAWIAESGNVVAMKVLAMHRETIEPRRPVAEGGDGTLRICIVARRRADVVRCAIQLGWTGAALPMPDAIIPDRHKRAPSAAADSIRQASGAATHAYLVGKGPSLDRLTAGDFPAAGDPILCANEAVHAIERLNLPNPVFGVQQDARLRQAARPTSATWLLSSQAWKQCKGYEYAGAVQYDSAAIGGSTKSLTANQSLRLLGMAGFRTVTMLAFDACTCQQTDYAASVGVKSSQFGQNPKRFVGYCPEIARVGKIEGMAMTWQPPGDGWTVVCVLRTGGRYGVEHVEWLRAQVASRIKTPHRFACLTDAPGMAPYAIPLAHGWPGWWSKLELGRPGLFAGGVLYLDLDVVLPREITLPHWDTLTRGEVYARPDWSRAGQINSSVMLWRGDAMAGAYATFLGDPGRAMQEYRTHGDQAFTSRAMQGHIQPCPLVVNSYKLSKGAKPDETDVMVFHGDPKPWKITQPWIPPMATPKGRGEFLARMCRDLAARVVVEVGTKEGKTSEAILRALPEVRVYNVDLFQPQPKITDGEHYNAWNWDGIIKDFRARMTPFRERCVTLIADQCDAARMVPEICDLVFLDADHRTEPTRAAIRAWLPKVRPGGILAGHDYDWPSVAEAVAAEFGERASIQTGPDAVWYVVVGGAANGESDSHG